MVNPQRLLFGVWNVVLFMFESVFVVYHYALPSQRSWSK
jgi:hypothetical protein